MNVDVSSSKVSIEIGTRETLNFTADYVLGLSRGGSAWHLPQPFGHPAREISSTHLGQIQRQILKLRKNFEEEPRERLLSDRDGWTFEQVGGGTAAIHEDGRRYWWPDEMAEDVAPEVLGSDWKDVGYTTQDGLDLGPEYSNRGDKPLRPGYAHVAPGITHVNTGQGIYVR